MNHYWKMLLSEDELYHLEEHDVDVTSWEELSEFLSDREINSCWTCDSIFDKLYNLNKPNRRETQCLRNVK